MEESYDLVNKERFGLFSWPGCLAIGENTYAPQKVPNKDEDDRMVTEPPNFLTTQGKKGKQTMFFFSSPSYVSTGDPYNDKTLMMREGKKDGHKTVCDLHFKPTKTVPKPIKADFEHMPEDDLKKKNYKDVDGNAILAPRNFTTTAAKKGNFILKLAQV